MLRIIYMVFAIALCLIASALIHANLLQQYQSNASQHPLDGSESAMRLDRLLQAEPSWVVLGTTRYNELLRQADDRNATANLLDGWKNGWIGQKIALRGASCNGSVTSRTYVGEYYERLIDRVPSKYHHSIFRPDCLKGALHARDVILARLEVQRRITNQFDTLDQLAFFIGALPNYLAILGLGLMFLLVMIRSLLLLYGKRK